MHIILIASVVLPMLGPFDPPPGPLPVQPPEFPELDVASTPEVPDFEEPTVSDAYADKLAETEAKLSAVAEGIEAIDSATSDMADLLPASDGTDADLGLTDDNGDPLTAAEYASSTESSLADLFRYMRLALYFNASLSVAVFAHMLRAALFVLTIYIILMILKFLVWLFGFIFEIIKPLIKLAGTLAEFV